MVATHRLIFSHDHSRQFVWDARNTLVSLVQDGWVEAPFDILREACQMLVRDASKHVAQHWSGDTTYVLQLVEEMAKTIDFYNRGGSQQHAQTVLRATLQSLWNRLQEPFTYRPAGRLEREHQTRAFCAIVSCTAELQDMAR